MRDPLLRIAKKQIRQTESLWNDIVGATVRALDGRQAAHSSHFINCQDSGLKQDLLDLSLFHCITCRINICEHKLQVVPAEFLPDSAARQIFSKEPCCRNDRLSERRV